LVSSSADVAWFCRECTGKDRRKRQRRCANLGQAFSQFELFGEFASHEESLFFVEQLLFCFLQLGQLFFTDLWIFQEGTLA
jgi:hypothetical protein